MGLAGVPAAQLGVGGHGELPLPAGGPVPVGPVGHDGGEHGLAFPVGIAHRPVAGRQDLLLAGPPGPGLPAGRAGLGVRADGGEAGFLAPGADLAQFIAGPLGRPGGLDRVGVAQVRRGPSGTGPGRLPPRADS